MLKSSWSLFLYLLYLKLCFVRRNGTVTYCITAHHVRSVRGVPGAAHRAHHEPARRSRRRRHQRRARQSRAQAPRYAGTPQIQILIDRAHASAMNSGHRSASRRYFNGESSCLLLYLKSTA